MFVDELQPTAHDGLAGGRVRMDVPTDRAKAKVVLHREGHLVHHFTGAFGDDGRSENLVGSFSRNDFDESHVAVFEQRAVVVLQSGPVDLAVDAFPFRVILRGDPHRRHFGFGVRHSRNHEAADLPVVVGEAVLDRQLGHFSRHVCQPGNTRATVSNGEDTRVAHRSREVVDDDTLPDLVLHATILQSTIFDVGQASGCNEQALTLQFLVSYTGLDDRESFAVVFQCFYAGYGRAREEGHAIFFEFGLQDGGSFWITGLGFKQSRGTIHHRDFRPQKRK
mmetsp:Transcript_25541/g.59860  ORF Transcript_25541/g.59860 Transcript_25541/m.59860 type:complete len:279 (-) Transcript_25541:941-1777(-)